MRKQTKTESQEERCTNFKQRLSSHDKCVMKAGLMYIICYHSTRGTRQVLHKKKSDTEHRALRVRPVPLRTRVHHPVRRIKCLLIRGIPLLYAAHLVRFSPFEATIRLLRHSKRTLRTRQQVRERYWIDYRQRCATETIPRCSSAHLGYPNHPPRILEPCLFPLLGPGMACHRRLQILRTYHESPPDFHRRQPWD